MRNRFRAMAVGAVLLVAWGCSKENNIDNSQTNNYSQAVVCEGPAVDNAMCEAAAEAPTGALCVYGFCRQPCTSDVQCEALVPGSVCLPEASGSGCRLPQEVGCEEGKQGCAGGLVCWSGECRAPCTNDECFLQGLTCEAGVCTGQATGAYPEPQPEAGPGPESGVDAQSDSDASNESSVEDGPADAVAECVPIAATDLTCDGMDDDCNGTPDDGVDFCTDVENCGECGANCTGKAHATGECTKTDPGATVCNESNAECAVGDCEPGWYDANGVYADGCEYHCTPSKRTDPMNPSTLVQCDPSLDPDCGTIEYCDGVDDDCDGKIDAADPDLLDIVHGDPLLGQTCHGDPLGECAGIAHAGITQCIFATVSCEDNNLGTTLCVDDSSCSVPTAPSCIPGTNPPDTVCGSTVLKAGEQTEVCNTLDDDCNGVSDDEPAAAQECETRYPSAVSVESWNCMVGVCTPVCVAGHTDANLDPEDGCES